MYAYTTTARQTVRGRGCTGAVGRLGHVAGLYASLAGRLAGRTHQARSRAPGWVVWPLVWPGSRALLGYLAPRRRGGACWVDDATLEARMARSVASYRELARARLDLSARRSTGPQAGAGSSEVPLARGTSPASRSGRKWQDRRCTVRRKKKSGERVRVRREKERKEKKRKRKREKVLEKILFGFSSGLKTRFYTLSKL